MIHDAPGNTAEELQRPRPAGSHAGSQESHNNVRKTITYHVNSGDLNSSL
jgi:hypothetical protein